MGSYRIMPGNRVEVPHHMRHLPVDERMLVPIPWFVQIRPNEPIDFRIADPHKFVQAIKQQRCWCCGRTMTKAQAYLVGPMCEITRVTSEPPMHPDCARYAVSACPFLSNPKMRRSPRPKPEEADAPGISIDRNPGVVALLQSKHKPRVFKAGVGYLIDLPVAWKRQYWREGRLATVHEVWDSVLTGLPLLVPEAKQQGLAAMVELALRVSDYHRILAQHFGEEPAPMDPFFLMRMMHGDDRGRRSEATLEPGPGTHPAA